MDATGAIRIALFLTVVIAAATAAEPRADDALPRSVAPRGPATLADLVEQGRGNSGIPDAAGDGPFAPPAAGPRQPIPPVDQLTAAGRLLEEVFGKRLAAAKTPADKGKLAREIIEAVRNEPDAAARYVAWSQARILAVEARDGRLALSAVRLLAGQFESDAGPAADAERLARADRLWAEADKAEGRQRLDKQLEAVGEYWRAAPQSGLVARKWDARIETVSRFGKIIFHARDVTVRGQTLRYDEKQNAVCDWGNPTDWMEWSGNLETGEFTVEIEYSARGNGGGHLFAVVVVPDGSKKPSGAIEFELESTGGWDSYKTKSVGVITIRQSGPSTVRIGALRKIRGDVESYLANIRQVVFTQAQQDQKR